MTDAELRIRIRKLWAMNANAELANAPDTVSVRANELPKPPELWEAPELSSLAALAVALELADSSLCAAYPEFCELDAAYQGGTPPLVVCVAKIIFSQSERLRPAITIYRRARRARCCRWPAAVEEDDIPF